MCVKKIIALCSSRKLSLTVAPAILACPTVVTDNYLFICSLF